MKANIKARYKAILIKQREMFDSEKQDMIEIVRHECMSIVNEAKRQRENGDMSGVRIASTGDDGHREIVIYPEMLSPETTLDLVKSIASRYFFLTEYNEFNLTFYKVL